MWLWLWHAFYLDITSSTWWNQEEILVWPYRVCFLTRPLGFRFCYNSTSSPVCTSLFCSNINVKCVQWRSLNFCCWGRPCVYSPFPRQNLKTNCLTQRRQKGWPGPTLSPHFPQMLCHWMHTRFHKLLFVCHKRHIARNLLIHLGK